MRNLWSFVVHDVGTTSANIWIGTLHAYLKKPERMVAKVCDGEGNLLQTQYVNKDQWNRPFPCLQQRFCYLLTLDDLSPFTRYRVSFYAQENGQETEIRESEVVFDTLGSSLADYPKGLNIAMGSCFSEEHDGGSVSTAYTTLYRENIEDISPHFNFLLGDQVYLDVGVDSLNMDSKEIQERIAGDYAVSWHALRGVFRHGATWFLADDHEFWNNYPFVSGPYPFIQALRLDHVREAWEGASREAVDNIQRVENVRFINIGSDLSFCMADFRTRRTEFQLLEEREFEQILSWIAALKSPGVLVISQPLVDAHGKEDKKLPDYAQYRALIKAMQEGEHDILVLAGDLHCGRVCSFQFVEAGRNNTQRMLHEVVASPLSNLCGPTSFATRTTCDSDRPRTFPPTPVAGVSQGQLQYPNEWCVSTEFSVSDIRYLKERTKEHFKTLNFQKRDGGIEVKVRAWCVRHIDEKTGLAREDFNEPITLFLR